ncbi:glycine zipper 2TM domain-containing protein [Pseudoxanthomonas putridarboris]|uniref:Glycine zipper 2TM domain-containing protein n=1 Tax=Pseudoxanthomonas putridarboris TaxID=752605 RepID=A0ABU9IY79_9GAMM
MKRVSATLLAMGLLASGVASAQSTRHYGTDERDAYGPHYDYARVVRVDPVIDDGYRGTARQNCYYREADDVYARDGYRDDGYRYPDDYRGEGYGDRRYPGTGSESGRTVATVIGGIAGAVLGSKVGDGSGRYVGTAVGSMVGGMAGRSIYDSAQRDRQAQRGRVRVCDPVPAGDRGYGGDYYGDGRVSGYDVTYEYGNRTYHTRTDHHPGDRIRVRVDVRPE